MTPVVVAAIQWADLRIEVDPVTGEARRDPRRYGLPDADAAALELALSLAERWRGEVLAVTAGPPLAEAALREALAVGAARAVRVDLPEDTSQAAIAGALAPIAEGAAVVCCGAAGPDRASGSVPGFLAHRLGAAQALGLVSVEPGATGTIGELTAVRRLDGGRRERVRLLAPAVLSVEGAAARLRRASLAGELAARTATVETEPGSPGADASSPPSQRLPFRPRTHVVPPPIGATPTARIGALVAPVVTLARAEPEVLDPAAAADRLLEVLHAWGELP